MSKLETNTIDTVSGTTTLQIGSTNTGTITLGASGDTIKMSAGTVVSNPSIPCFTVWKNADQTGTTGDIISFQNAITNNGNHFNTSTYRFTAPQDGFYFFIADYLTDNAGTYSGDTRIWKNGVAFNLAGYANSTGTAFKKGVVSGIMELETNDYIELRMQGSQVIYGSAGVSHTKFSGFKIG